MARELGISLVTVGGTVTFVPVGLRGVPTLTGSRTGTRALATVGGKRLDERDVVKLVKAGGVVSSLGTVTAEVRIGAPLERPGTRAGGSTGRTRDGSGQRAGWRLA